MISFALMVKNEEKNIERCLKSIAPLNAEIVILDTGSTDKTVEIAQKYTKNIYHQKWQNNFSLHRNKSFSYCKNDWIFQIDADEELHFNKTTQVDFKFWLHSLPKEVHAVGLQLRDYRKSEDTYHAELDIIRIFRKGKVKYRRRIHNEPMYDGQPILTPHIWLKHYGYDLTPEQQEAKSKRTIGLLLKSLEDDPQDYQSLYYLAQAYGSWGDDSAEALKYATKYEKNKDKLGKNFNAGIYYYGAFQSYQDDNMDACKQWIDKGIRHNMETLDLDLSFMVMLYGEKINKGQLIIKGATAFIMAYENIDELRQHQVGRNFFNNKLSSYAYALYYFTLYHLNNGSNSLKKMKDLLPQVNTKTRNQIEAQIKADLDQFGLKDKDERRIITPSDAKYHNTLLQTSKVA